MLAGFEGPPTARLRGRRQVMPTDRCMSKARQTDVHRLDVRDGRSYLRAADRVTSDNLRVPHAGEDLARPGLQAVRRA
jgi:hypothetical protein